MTLNCLNIKYLRDNRFLFYIYLLIYFVEVFVFIELMA